MTVVGQHLPSRVRRLSARGSIADLREARAGSAQTREGEGHALVVVEILANELSRGSIEPVAEQGEDLSDNFQQKAA